MRFLILFLLFSLSLSAAQPKIIVGRIVLDPDWTEFNSYINDALIKVQRKLEENVEKHKIRLTEKCDINLNIVINMEGQVVQITNPQAMAQDNRWADTCAYSIAQAGNFGEWTKEMVAALGTRSQFKLKFFVDLK